MRILIIHNRYSHSGGEESVVAMQAAQLAAAGHEVRLFERDYNEIQSWRFGKITSFFSALYNGRSVAAIKHLIAEFQPEVALVHNLFPVVSPAVLAPLRRAGVKVLFFAHNYRLVCPVGTVLRDAAICTLCATKCREGNCVTRKCEGSLMGSIAFAVRGWWSRSSGAFANNVTTYCALSDFQRDKLLSFSIKGVTGDNVVVLPNAVDFDRLPAPSAEFERRKVALVGRFSIEKGAIQFLEAARRLPHMEFQVAGFNSLPELEIPQNVTMCGVLNSSELADFYAESKIILSTSICWESFGLTIVEGMAYGAVAVVPNIAAMPELVDYGKCGLVYEAGNVDALCQSIERLYSDDLLCNELVSKALERVRAKYGIDKYVERLIAIATK